MASLCPLVTEGQSQQRRRLTRVKFNFSQTQHGHSRSQCVLAYLLLCFKKIHVNPLGDEASAGGMPVGWAAAQCGTAVHPAGSQPPPPAGDTRWRHPETRIFPPEAAERQPLF